jgi:hypothetical protein
MRPKILYKFCTKLLANQPPLHWAPVAPDFRSRASAFIKIIFSLMQLRYPIYMTITTSLDLRTSEKNFMHIESLIPVADYQLGQLGLA